MTVEMKIPAAPAGSGLSPLASVRTIAAQQRRSTLAGARGALFVCFWSLLVALAVWSGALAAAGDRRDAAASEQAVSQGYADWLAAYGTDAWRPVYLISENPLILHKPPAPGRALAGGAEASGGAWVAGVGYYARELEGRKADLSPLGSLFGNLDLAGLVAAAGALAAIALGFDAISGEKERGTLALHFANALSRPSFLAGKILGAWQALALALGGPLAVGLALLLLVGALDFGPASLGRIVAFWLASLLYLAFWSALAVAVSALARSSATSFVALVGVWLVLSLAWPKAALGIAGQLAPVRAPAELEQTLNAALTSSKVFYQAEIKAYKASHNGERPWGADLSRLKLRYFDHHFATLAPATRAYEAELDRRSHTFEALAALSPSFVYQQLTASLAGTDAARQRAFLGAANAYLRTLKYESEQRILRGQEGAPARAELPPFGFRSPRFASCLPGVALRALGLLLALALAAALAAFAFRRYDLRPQGAA